MNNSMHTIVEKLALLEGRIKQDDAPKSKPVAALLKKESAIPMVGGPEIAESGVAEDVLSKVKDSFTDYLKNLEDQIKQDKDLLKKKKEDLDLKKSELKDLDLKIKDHKQAQAAAVEELEEEPNQTPAQGEAPAGSSNPTYAQGSNNTYESSTPVKTVVLDEMGGSVLVEIHSDGRGNYEIRRNGQCLPTRFKTVSECEMALDLYRARRAEQNNPDSSADYLEEK